MIRAVPATQTARARVRAELTREIIEAAQAELAAEGAVSLSLRAVARRLDMVPSALYRYFPSRDALLTALIIETFNELGDAAAAADDPRRKPRARWLAVASAVRAWARANPHSWALVFGSPVPGYQAPEATVEPALKMTRVVTGIIADAVGPGEVPTAIAPAPAGLGRVVVPVESELLPGRAPEVVVAALMAWTNLVGTVSLELFGHYKGGTTDFDRVFDYSMKVMASWVGIP